MDKLSVNNLQLDVPICRICHSGDNDTDSFFNGQTKLTINSSSSSPFSLSTSSTSSSSDNAISELSLITPCCCSGSLKYVHHYCLQQWIRSSNNKYCELCKYHFKMSVKFKPLYKWERLEMSNSERRKLLYNLLFNLISMFCVFWSIYVLIERATFEAKYGLLDWPFWTKMLVVSIGFLGGTIFLFVQLRLYLSIFMRWRQYNRIIIIHNCDNKKATSNAPKIEKKSSFELDLSGIK
uniref:RING-CH-type domain-containing protein n=1 Tax=Tetranychus urticae TaxID=32264 RepID=T1K361_TETUR